MNRPARHWCFTQNNPKDELDFDERPVKWLRYCVWQKEQGDGGTVHYQGYMEFSRAVRLSALRKAVPGAHYEERRGSRDQAREYCRKSDRLDGPWEWGDWVGGQGTRTDLELSAGMCAAGRSLADIAREQPSVFVKFHRGLAELRRVSFRPRRRLELKVYLIWGVTGSGKSRYVWDMWGEEVYSLASQKPVWFDGYDGQKVLLIDEFEGVLEFGREKLLKVLDIYPYLAPVKGGHVYAQWDKIYITSNNDLEAEFRGDTALWRRVTRCEWVS